MNTFRENSRFAGALLFSPELRRKESAKLVAREEVLYHQGYRNLLASRSEPPVHLGKLALFSAALGILSLSQASHAGEVLANRYPAKAAR